MRIALRIAFLKIVFFWQFLLKPLDNLYPITPRKGAAPISESDAILKNYIGL